MNPSRYARLRALADDPRTPKHERETAQRRVAEYEAKHGRPAPPPPPPPPPPRWMICHCGHLKAKHRRQRGPCYAIYKSKLCPCKRFDPLAVGWWTLPVAWTKEIRDVVRSLRYEMERAGRCSDLYGLPSEVVDRIRRREVDWRWFPESEPAGKTWRPPAAMRAAMREDRGG